MASRERTKQQENTLSELNMVKEGLAKSIQAKKDSLRKQ